MAEERQNHAAATQEEINNLKARLRAENSEASQRLSEELQDAERARRVELQNQRETYESRMVSSQEDSRRIIEALQKDVQELTRQTSEARSCHQQDLDAREIQLRERLEADHARQSEILRGEIASLTSDLKNKQGCEALAREEARRHADEYIRVQAIAHENGLRELREQLRSAEALRASDLETRARELQNRDEEHGRILREREDWLKAELVKKEEFLARRDEAISAASEAQRQAAIDYSERISSLTASLTGTSASIGAVGEFFVSTVFARMNLGTWQDDSRNPAEGFADALWAWTPPNCPPLAVMIDVKRVNQIHSKHDVEKFYSDLSAAIACNRANAGMLISLNARCPNTSPLDISLFHGVPVCIVSRAANDDLSPASMVEMAFMAAQAWPLICRQKGGGDEQTIAAAGQHLDVQLQDLEKFMKRIMSIAGLATRMAREAEGLRKNAQEMIKGIEVLRQSHPQLSPVMDEVPDDEPDESPDDTDWDSQGAKDFVAAYNAYLDGQAANTKTHYPKSLDKLKLSESAEAFVKENPNAFQLTGDKVKEQRRIAGVTKRRRVADSSE